MNFKSLDTKVQQPTQPSAARQTDLLDRDDRDLGDVDPSRQGNGGNVLGAHGIRELGLGELQHDLGVHDLGDDAAVAGHAGALAQVTGACLGYRVVRALELGRGVGAVVVGRTNGTVVELDELGHGGIGSRWAGDLGILTLAIISSRANQTLLLLTKSRIKRIGAR